MSSRPPSSGPGQPAVPPATQTPTVAHARLSKNIRSVYSSTSPHRTSFAPPRAGEGDLAFPDSSTTPTMPADRSAPRYSLDSYRAPSPAPNARFSSPDDIRTLIQQAFSPHVAVLASPDSEEIVRRKGIRGGLTQLLRPYGERISGRVETRTAKGLPRLWDDYGVRFVPFNRSLRLKQKGELHSPEDSITNIETLVEKHIRHGEEEQYAARQEGLSQPDVTISLDTSRASPYYSLYVRRLLSSLPVVQHETFSHPVACVIAISSHTPNPLDTLESLHRYTVTKAESTSKWVHAEYLRYYVLVHDEDNDNFAESALLFEKMKRQYGSYCQMLRIRSAQCVPSDSEAIQIPPIYWQSATEELEEIRRVECQAEELEDSTPCIFKSDEISIISFVRDMVAASIIPNMERLAHQWSNQALTKRKGISARLTSLSKRWTFGSAFSVGGHNFSLGNNTKTNYQSSVELYDVNSPEATLRKLADFYFMLRDYGSAHEVYELIIQDFETDGAWKYYAGASEMTAISALMNLTQSLELTGRGPKEPRPKDAEIDRWVEGARFSYSARAAEPYFTLRCCTLVMELFRLYNSDVAPAAAAIALKILQMKLLKTIGYPLYTERLSICHANRVGLGGSSVRTRRRQAAFWTMIASQSWMRISALYQAEIQAKHSQELYRNIYDNALQVNNETAGSLQLFPNAGFMEGIDGHLNDIVSFIQTQMNTEPGLPTGEVQILKGTGEEPKSVENRELDAAAVRPDSQ